MDEYNPVNCKLPVWPSNSRPFYCRHGGTSGCRSCTRDWQLVTTDFPDVESAPEVLLGSELAPPSPLQPQDWLLTRNGRLEQTPEWTLNSTEPQQQAMNFSSAARCHWGRHRHVANQLTEGYTRSVRGGVTVSWAEPECSLLLSERWRGQKIRTRGNSVTWSSARAAERRRMRWVLESCSQWKIKTDETRAR